MELLQNRKVLIVGATGDIGAETARLLHSNKAVVYLTGRDTAKLNEVGDHIGIPADRRFTLDITDRDAVQDVAEQLHGTLNQVDILVNAAGIGIIKPIDQLSYEEFDRSIDTNLKGTFYLLKSFLPPMKEAKKGLIINIPGVLGKAPMAGASAYAASKYGLNGMLKSVREELKRTRIRITNLYLGGVDSAFWDNIDLRVQRDKMITAKEAARAVWFLCQQPSSGVVSEMVVQPFNHQVL